MLVNTIVVKLYAPWVHSLKEKRMIIKSLSNRLSNKFNISIAEIDNQDIHHIITIGIAFISANMAQSDSIYEHISAFIEASTEAEITDITKTEYTLA